MESHSHLFRDALPADGSPISRTDLLRKLSPKGLKGADVTREADALLHGGTIVRYEFPKPARGRPGKGYRLA